MEGMDVIEFLDLLDELHSENGYEETPVYVNGNPLGEMQVNRATVFDPDSGETFIAITIE